jgi:hypothetical protein
MNRYSLTVRCRIFFRTNDVEFIESQVFHSHSHRVGGYWFFCEFELVAEPRGSVGAGGHTFQVGAVADDDRGNDECEDAKDNKRVGFLRGAFPLMENPSPHRGKNDDRGHVERPGRESKTGGL